MVEHGFEPFVAADPSHPPPLGEREVHVWLVELDAPAPWEGADELSVLCVTELDRARAIVDPLGARRWARSRVLLRELLGGYLGREPASLRFAVGAHGKPRLAGDAAGEVGWLRFNLSHSGELALYALARDLEVGVDIELLGRERNFVGLAQRAFGAAAARRLELTSPERREQELLGLWVRYEARLKCQGAGFGHDNEAAGPPGCFCSQIALGDAAVAVAAVAAAAAPVRVELRRWPLYCAYAHKRKPKL